MSEPIVSTRGLPGYTFERAAGELWRSRFDAERNLIIVNHGHRDFVFAKKKRALQLRYLVRQKNWRSPNPYPGKSPPRLRS